MTLPPIPTDEDERLSDLESYDIMDSLPESDYDNLTKIASEICQTPVALITLMGAERQWFKSKIGVELSENKRDFTFCAHGMINPKEPLVVNDASKDPRFANNPLVTGEHHVRFYAGVQLVSKTGFPLGSICVFDVKENKLSTAQLETLKVLGQQVIRLLELRKTVRELESSKADLLRTNKQLKEFDYIISHDLKAPLRNVKYLTEAINEMSGEKMNDKEKKYLHLINETASDAISYVDGILNYSQATYYIDVLTEEIDLNSFLKKIIQQETVPAHVSISIPDNLPTINGSKAAFRQIFSNLINNAIKYNDKAKGWVKILYSADDGYHNFQISDNGKGIPEDKIESIFALFFVVNKGGTRNSSSSGVGLSIVKNLVTEMKGKISVKSTLGEGTTFELSIPR